MQFKIKGVEIDTIDILILATPLFAVLFLTLLILHSGVNLTDSLMDKGQLIVMPRNCYLKIP